MMEIIMNYVNGFDGKKVTVNGRDGYRQGDYVYFTIPKENIEEIHLEQRAVSAFLIKKGLHTIAVPIANREGKLITKVNQRDLLVYRMKLSDVWNAQSHAKRLASFHKLGSQYPYEPNYISSYGQWRELWKRKIKAFENIYNQQYKEKPVSPFHRLFIDTFPYLIGLSENAMQYLQEAESDERFHNSDQPCITFGRYSNQLQHAVIWSSELTYDHPVRDIAEHIRPILLEDDDSSLWKLKSFFTEYEQTRPLSIFGWRLLYARLLFPVQLYDQIEEGFQADDLESVYMDYEEILKKQANYETNLMQFFNKMDIDVKSLEIPVLDW